MNKSKKFSAYKSVARINSVSEYRLRAYLDQCVHNDVYEFTSKRDVATERLVEMLLAEKFTHRRSSDPSFPI
jgi:hypothetical protein